MKITVFLLCSFFLIGSVSALYWSPSYKAGSSGTTSSIKSSVPLNPSSNLPSNPLGVTSTVSARFIKQACREEQGCGMNASKVAVYNPFKRKIEPSIVKDPELLAINRVKYLYKATFNQEPQDEYVLKEAKLMVQRGYPEDIYAESRLRTAYKKSPSLYLRHAKKTALSQSGYSGYKRTTN